MTLTIASEKGPASMSSHLPPRPRSGRKYILGPDASRRPDTTRVKPQPAAMLVCTRTEVFTSDGQIDQVVAGRDRVRADHPIVRKFPGSFRPLKGSELRPNTRSVIRGYGAAKVG